MSRRQAVEEYRKIFRLLTKFAQPLPIASRAFTRCRYKRDLRRVYRFYASIGAKSRVKASGDLSQALNLGQAL
jgi:hypothetical protein